MFAWLSAQSNEILYAWQAEKRAAQWMRSQAPEKKQQVEECIVERTRLLDTHIQCEMHSKLVKWISVCVQTKV